MSTSSNFHARDLVTVVARLFSTIIFIFLAGCTPNAPYRDLNVLSDPSNFGGYIGGKPQQDSPPVIERAGSAAGRQARRQFTVASASPIPVAA